MSGRGLTYFEQHFFFSKHIIRFFIRIRPDNSLYVQIFVLCVLTVIVLPIIVHQICTLDTKLQQSIKVFLWIIPGIYFLSCFYRIYTDYFQYKQLLAHIKFDYELVIQEEELHIIDEYNKRSKLFVYLLVVLINLMSISIISPSILNTVLYVFGATDDSHLILPFPVYNVVHAGLLYYSWLAYQIIVVFVAVTIGSIILSFAWIIVQHACCLLRIMVFKISQPFRSSQSRIHKNFLCRTFQKENDWMVNIIIFYARILKYIDLLNSVFKGQYLVATTTSLLLILLNFLYIFNLSFKLQNAREIVECYIYISGSLFAIYTTFYVGQLLIDHSNDVFLELCNIPFYDLSIKTQKLLLFVLMRSTKLSRISIGGLFIARHEDFAGLIQKSFSFATVFYSTL